LKCELKLHKKPYFCRKIITNYTNCKSQKFWTLYRKLKSRKRSCNRKCV